VATEKPHGDYDAKPSSPKRGRSIMAKKEGDLGRSSLKKGSPLLSRRSPGSSEKNQPCSWGRGKKPKEEEEISKGGGVGKGRTTPARGKEKAITG